MDEAQLPRALRALMVEGRERQEGDLMVGDRALARPPGGWGGGGLRHALRIERDVPFWGGRLHIRRLSVCAPRGTPEPDRLVVLVPSHCRRGRPGLAVPARLGTWYGTVHAHLASWVPHPWVFPRKLKGVTSRRVQCTLYLSASRGNGISITILSSSPFLQIARDGGRWRCRK